LVFVDAVNALEEPLFLERNYQKASELKRAEDMVTTYLGVFILFRKLLSSLSGYGVRSVQFEVRAVSTMNKRCSQKWASPGMST
jgi:hypothetical protein